MRKTSLVILLAVLALGAFFRFYRLAETPPGLYPDEAMNGSNAQEALATGHFKVFYPENNGREGVFINLQAISVAAFGSTPWALRVVSAIMGILTIAAIYLVARELTARRATALLAAFFTAVSYWHINFSRIGFRAIMLPLVACLGMHFLLRGLRRGKPYDIIAAGLCTGLGLYTYIAFRFMVFVFAVPVLAAANQWRRARKNKTARSVHCIPCSLAMYVFVAFVAIIPIGLYFTAHPQDFVNRAGEISVFTAASPAKEIARSAGLTLQMFFWRGDGNWRHNLPYAAQLHPLVAFLFLAGLVSLIRAYKTRRRESIILFVWFSAMLLPAALTREGMPHALRAIGMIPPVMILAAIGATAAYDGVNAWAARKKAVWPQKAVQLERIRRELVILGLLALLTIPLAAYRDYFLVWADKPQTYDAFDTGSLHLGQYLADLPQETKKYVIVNTLGTPVRGIPMPAQTVMFVTDTFAEEARARKNFSYVAGGSAGDITLGAGRQTVIAILDGTDRALIKTLQHTFPALRVRAPGDFVIFQDY